MKRNAADGLFTKPSYLFRPESLASKICQLVPHQFVHIIEQVLKAHREIVLEVVNIFIRPFIAMCDSEHIPELQDPAQVVSFHLSLRVIDPLVNVPIILSRSCEALFHVFVDGGHGSPPSSPVFVSRNLRTFHPG